MKVLRNLSWTRVPVLFAVMAILSGVLLSPAAIVQEEKSVENFPTVLQRVITLWSDGIRLSSDLPMAAALMGNIAARVKGELLYDSQELRFTNSKKADALLIRKPRYGCYL